MNQKDVKSPAEGNAWMSNTFVVLSMILVLAIGGVGGYFIGRSSGNETAIAPMAQGGRAPALPPGVKPLPPRAFDHWVLACVENAQNAKRCELALRVVDKNKHGLLLAMIVGRSNKGKPVLLVVTPPNALLPQGLRLTFGSKPETKVDFVSCARQSCRAVLPLDQAQQDALSDADTTQVAWTAGNGRVVSYKVPTDKFSDAFEAWQSAMPQPAQQ